MSRKEIALFYYKGKRKLGYVFDYKNVAVFVVFFKKKL
ncbi:hypothetical protein HMPREF1002_04396 [Porphyromonas sp. 31_2]|nr:hypothetical protein HMPREF1002_04396 [Porphyromonas sp. 31_2]